MTTLAENSASPQFSNQLAHKSASGPPRGQFYTHAVTALNAAMAHPEAAESPPQLT